MTSTASAIARSADRASEPSVLNPANPTNSRIGTTAKSWNSRMAKLLRPAGVLRRRLSIRSWLTKAVDDKASERPNIVAATIVFPNRKATSPIAAALAATCAPPSPNTSLRIAQSCATDNSRPMVKSRKMTPSSAKRRKPSRSLNTKYSRTGMSPESRPIA